jgi:hypothetical protein
LTAVAKWQIVKNEAAPHFSHFPKNDAANAAAAAKKRAIALVVTRPHGKLESVYFSVYSSLYQSHQDPNCG